MASFVSAMFVEAPSIVVFVLMQMSLGLTLNVIVGFSVVDGRWRGREAILDLEFTIIAIVVNANFVRNDLVYECLLSVGYVSR